MMTVADLVHELQKHEQTLPVCIGYPHIFSPDIHVEFNSHYGIILESPSQNEAIREMLSWVSEDVSDKLTNALEMHGAI